MRGKVHFFSLPRFFTRITPAYAGKSFKNSKFSRVAQDHPRLCGEKGSPSLYSRSSSGSPPPMRGKAPFRFVVVACGGITPAYAGKSIRTLRNSHHDQDHPRLCGEKFSNCDEKTTCVGSPPPMRGKVALFSAGMCLIRITPAYAGKSRCTGSSRGNCWDHPRLCGEKRELMSKSAAIAGSPPPMRGRGPLLVCSLHTSRITPAYAGKSHLIQIIMM